jgi:2-hydroxy-6-oxonona-2,4-dienedioate hydrolase
VERGILLFGLIANAEFHLFDQCAHWVQWDQAERFNRLVADFLKS